MKIKINYYPKSNCSCFRSVPFSKSTRKNETMKLIIVCNFHTSNASISGNKPRYVRKCSEKCSENTSAVHSCQPNDPAIAEFDLTICYVPSYSKVKSVFTIYLSMT